MFVLNIGGNWCLLDLYNTFIFFQIHQKVYLIIINLKQVFDNISFNLWLLTFFLLLSLYWKYILPYMTVYKYVYLLVLYYSFTHEMYFFHNCHNILLFDVICSYFHRYVSRYVFMVRYSFFIYCNNMLCK